MDRLNNGGKKKQSFTILSNDSTSGHGGYGAGVINLNNVTPVIVDVDAEEAFIEMGALHARSPLERGIKFLPNKEEVPNGKPYWLVWVTVHQKDGEPYYGGVTACEMTIDRSIRRGYKSLPEHVNNMDKSLKGQIIVEQMDQKSKAVLKNFLKSHNEEMWKRSEETLHQQLSE